MSDTERFLARWSRRKRDAADEQDVAAKPVSAPPDAPAAGEGKPENASKAAPAGEKTAPPAPAIDPATLPSLDSIGAQSDIRAFLQPGVPPELARAALRRAWSADPAIRDFRGLQENDWDFTAPGVPGFGPLGPEHDVGKLLAEVFGEAPPASEPANLAATAPPPRQTARLSNESAAPGERVASESTPELAHDARQIDPQSGVRGENSSIGATAQADLLQRAKNIAEQQKESESKSNRLKPQRHGGALPQ